MVLSAASVSPLRFRSCNVHQVDARPEPSIRAFTRCMAVASASFLKGSSVGRPVLRQDCVLGSAELGQFEHDGAEVGNCGRSPCAQGSLMPMIGRTCL